MGSYLFSHVIQVKWRASKKSKSVLPKDFDKTKDKALSNILSLAIGNGIYRISIESVNKISSEEFKIDWK